MNKDFQDFPTIYESAARCLAAGIRPSFNIIFAFPGEGAERAARDHEFRDGCVQKGFPEQSSGPISLPRIRVLPSWKRLRSSALHVPDSLEGWVDFFPRYTKLPWSNGRDHQELQVMRDYIRIAFDRVPISADTRTPYHQACTEMRLAARAVASLDHSAYRFPVELWLQ